MIQHTIEEIEARLKQTDQLTEENRQELLCLLTTLKTEMNTLSATHGEQAQSIARFTELSAHEAFRSEKNPRLLDLSLSGLKASVEGFENTHPKLVEIVNNMCTTLSNIGI